MRSYVQVLLRAPSAAQVALDFTFRGGGEVVEITITKIASFTLDEEMLSDLWYMSLAQVVSDHGVDFELLEISAE